MFDMPTTILDNTFKTTTPFIDTTVNETLRYRFSIQWQLFASLLPQSWIFVRDKLAAEGHPRQRNSLGCATGFYFVVVDSTAVKSIKRISSIDFSSNVFVLLGSVATELRWGGRHNNTFTRHEFLVLTVKEWLKSVYFYQSYRKK